MLPKLRPTMDNSMPDCGRHRHFGVDEKPSDTDDCFPLTRNGTGLGEQYASVRVFCAAFGAFVTDRFGLAGEQPFNPGRPNAIQSEFERGRTAVHSATQRTSVAAARVVVVEVCCLRHGLVAARLGYSEMALRYFRQTAAIDL